MRATIGAAVLVACVVAAWGSASGDMEDGPCRQACHENHAACVETCGDHSNPVECDSECSETLQDCLRECR
jgi:hypothetical protein